jgi:predicted GTPase
MAKLTCSVLANRSLSDLIDTREAFAPLQGRRTVVSNLSAWGRRGAVSHDLTLVVMGKSGYGKSTTLNKLVGEAIFPTSDVEACTRSMQSVDYQMCPDSQAHYLSIADLPGLGENPERDEEYIGLYSSVLEKSHLIVYLLRADQRDFSIDHWAFSRLFTTAAGRRKVLIAVNAVDKIEPLNRFRPFALSPEQSANVDRRLQAIAQEFDIPLSRIHPYSAVEDFGVDKICKAICSHLLEHVE